MKRDIQATVENGVVRIVYRGLVEYSATTEMLRNVAGLAAQTQCKLLLFDIREADYDHYHVDTIRHAEEAPALGIDRTFRVAFLGVEGNPMLRYIENVSVNRGFLAKVFTDDSEALAWLRGVP